MVADVGGDGFGHKFFPRPAGGDQTSDVGAAVRHGRHIHLGGLDLFNAIGGEYMVERRDELREALNGVEKAKENLRKKAQEVLGDRG